VRLESSVWLPRSRDEVFSWFADAFNLEAITPRWLRFEVRTAPPIAMRAGRLIEYRLRLRGVPLRWTSEITSWEPPVRFVDEQRRGPYRLWRHEHRFVAEDGGTTALDVVEYEVPGGRLVDRLFVRPDLERIFAFRREALARHLGGNGRTSRRHAIRR
jgi:ligand-binding SRPBCC domain-containing protein